MKRIIAVLIAAICVLSLCSCEKNASYEEKQEFLDRLLGIDTEYDSVTEEEDDYVGPTALMSDYEDFLSDYAIQTAEATHVLVWESTDGKETEVVCLYTEEDYSFITEVAVYSISDVTGVSQEEIDSSLNYFNNELEDSEYLLAEAYHIEDDFGALIVFKNLTTTEGLEAAAEMDMLPIHDDTDCLFDYDLTRYLQQEEGFVLLVEDESDYEADEPEEDLGNLEY